MCAFIVEKLHASNQQPQHSVAATSRPVAASKLWSLSGHIDAAAPANVCDKLVVGSSSSNSSSSRSRSRCRLCEASSAKKKEKEKVNAKTRE